MEDEASGLRPFQAGGALREGAIYVERAADRELYAALSAGELCYNVTPRNVSASRRISSVISGQAGSGLMADD
jgi:hypothetical protein